jgi:hypothetical protein
MKNVSFAWPLPEAALSTFNVSFSVTNNFKNLKRRSPSVLNRMLSKKVYLQKFLSVVQ